MLELNMVCYPWDLVDEGVDAVLDRLKGETGLTGVCVPVCVPAIEQFRPHAGVSPRTFRSAGGIQFQPQAATYAATRVQPVVADWLRKRNPLPDIAEGCRQRGLSFRARIVACAAPVVVQRHPAAAVKDVFGDTSSRWICPANPDVRAYLRAMLEDLAAHHAPDAIELIAAAFPPPAVRGRGSGFLCGTGSRPAGMLREADFQPVEPGTHGSPPPVDLTDWLLSLCFCESCRQRAGEAGVDAASAARSVQVTLDRLLEEGESVALSPAEFITKDPVVDAYVNWRCDQATSLLQSLRATCEGRFVIGLDGDRVTTGQEPGLLAAHADALLGCCARSDDESLTKTVGRLGDAAGSTDRVELAIDAGAGFADAAALVKCVKTAADMGVGAVTFASYGELPLRRLTWIRQASRYARRER